MSRRYDYNDPKPRRTGGAGIWGLLSIITLLCVACVAFYFVLVFTNPYTSLNPFPPPVVNSLASAPTATPTEAAITLPPSWTPTASPAPTDTPAPTATSTLLPTPTPVTLTPTPVDTPTPIPTPSGGYPYQVRQGSPKAIPNIYYPELGCNWMGVGGQVVDKTDNPVTGLIVRVGGRAPGIRIDENIFTLTGVAPNYGRAGYEFKLGDAPVPSNNLLWIQLVGQDGVPLSDQVPFSTYGECEKNLIIIDFKQVR